MLMLAAMMLGPQMASAMTVEMFDAMATEDQQDYLTLLVKKAREVLVQQDRKPLAAKLEKLFQTRRGQPQSPGKEQFEKNLATVRAYVAQQKWIKILPGEVENALIGVFQKNGILMSGPLFKTLSHAWTAKPYWPKRPLRTPSIPESHLN
jgi:hypothetical protein